MNKDKIKKILDKTDIYVLDEINILEYIDELEKVKEDYIKSLDKLDVLDNRNNKAIEYCEEITSREIDISDTDYDLGQDFTARDILDILRGEE